MFPRQLTPDEKYFLFSILPERKEGYKIYREKIEKLIVTGSGKSEGTNLILGKGGTKPDTDSLSSPVFAIGSIEYSDGKTDILIHEETDDEIEFDISGIKSFKKENEIKSWNFSDWEPGDKSPVDNLYVKEIPIKNNEFLLAVSSSQKKIWLYSYSDGINHLLPVSNLFNYLMIVKKIRDPKIVLKPYLFFDKLNEFSDREILSAFILYNKYFKRIKINFSEEELLKEKNHKKSFNFFRRK